MHTHTLGFFKEVGLLAYLFNNLALTNGIQAPLLPKNQQKKHETTSGLSGAVRSLCRSDAFMEQTQSCCQGVSICLCVCRYTASWLMYTQGELDLSPWKCRCIPSDRQPVCQPTQPSAHWTPYSLDANYTYAMIAGTSLGADDVISSHYMWQSRAASRCLVFFVSLCVGPLIFVHSCLSLSKYCAYSLHTTSWSRVSMSDYCCW